MRLSLLRTGVYVDWLPAPASCISDVVNLLACGIWNTPQCSHAANMQITALRRRSLSNRPERRTFCSISLNSTSQGTGRILRGRVGHVLDWAHAIEKQWGGHRAITPLIDRCQGKSCTRRVRMSSGLLQLQRRSRGLPAEHFVRR